MIAAPIGPPTTAATAPVASIAQVAPATGSIGLRLVDIPVAAVNDPRARLYIIDRLAPATTISRRIEVSNTTGSTARIELYAAAASIADGAFLGAASRTPNDLSTWTSVRPGTADVPAGGKLTADVGIAVPADAAPGEQYGVVWAEVRSGTPSGGITQVSRVGLRLYVSVGPGGAPASDFTILSLTPGRSATGLPTVRASVRNTGGRALDMTGTLRLLAGPGGLSAGPFPANLGTTLGIGETEPVTIVLDESIPAGPWDARIALHSGLLDRSARATITFPAAGSGPVVATADSGRGRLYAAVAAAVLLLLLAGVLVALLRRRRRAAPAR